MTFDVKKDMSWLGHDGFVLRTGDLTIAIDPYKLKTPIQADILLVTHSHYDHCSAEDIPLVLKPDTVIVTESESAATITKKGIVADFRVVKPGDNIEVKGVKIEVVPAYNIGKKFHPKKKNWLGFILTVDGTRVYHAGDTDLIKEMADFKVEVALLPVSGTYTMTAEEAVEAAKRIRPQIAIPMHYDSLVGTEQDAVKFKNSLQGVCEVVFPAKI